MLILAGLKSTGESVLELLGVLIIFIIVLVVCVFVTRFIANRQMKQKKQGNFEVVETFPVAQNRFLQLIRTGNKYIVIAICKDNVNFITELDESCVIFDKPQGQYQIKNFQDILSKYMNKNTAKNPEIENDLSSDDDLKDSNN